MKIEGSSIAVPGGTGLAGAVDGGRVVLRERESLALLDMETETISPWRTFAGLRQARAQETWIYVQDAGGHGVVRGDLEGDVVRCPAGLLLAGVSGTRALFTDRGGWKLIDLVARVAPKDVTVLLTGESGVGKDVLAASLHAHSKRSDKPFIRFNAAAIPAELAEAELFGHVKGAFTGAIASRTGYFQQAHTGTLFIDEVGELALPIQAKVLRALQSGDVQPVGGRGEHVDVRLVAATNRDLQAEVQAGRFREDLFYRLNVVPIRVPPLRERIEDIEPLVKAFVRTYSERYGMDEVHVEPALVEAFKGYAWPGNVREIENTVARLLALTADDRLTLALWRSLTDEARSPMSVNPLSGGAAGDPGPGHPLRARVESFERAIIRAEFESAHKNQSETARRLGVSRPALIEKLHKYALIGR